ncbi:hypothetical protein OPW36_20720 [Vibrio europaeus]|uniref:hypothetical protein n=1 Tax=Vibrio europaeus TaxID=300876 RepID=UPI00233EB0D3|nr:hypothetical protein [Vibrio europaeus]MDC5804767.1 hypothetical protein [Vibrio europaeus]MDC5827158.1 hypothetical protein [Vibrio europaeus]MDC5832524.1 hypothetical protein [Vibrio europaeus]MDC5835479.1 hypothetical protein [Vibrio europaeus]
MKKKIWTGKITGTNNGNVFLILEHKGSRVSGTLTINDYNFGVADYRVNGVLENGRVQLSGSPTSGTNLAALSTNIVYGTIEIDGQVIDSRIEGRWESSIGTKGVFAIEEQSYGSL